MLGYTQQKSKQPHQKESLDVVTAPTKKGVSVWQQLHTKQGVWFWNSPTKRRVWVFQDGLIWAE